MTVDLTIFTPTYNRANTLTRLYESIKGQTQKNFEWLIIDDGSNDNTQQIVENFISKKEIKIRYMKQQNSGKQAAWNKAVNEAKGKYFCNVDSDDILYDKYVIENLFNNYVKFLNENTVALRCLAISIKSKKPSASALGNDTIVIAKWEQEIVRNKVGDRNDLWLTSILKENLYPVTDLIKFIPETWLYCILNKKGFNFVYISVPSILIFDDHYENRLSQDSIFKNAEGQYIARACILNFLPLSVLLRNPIYSLKNIIRFSQCSNYLKTPFKKRLEDTSFSVALISYFLIFFFWK